MKKSAAFIDKTTGTYIGLYDSLAEFQPISAEGKILATKLPAFIPGDEQALENHHRRILLTMDFLSLKPQLIDHVLYHLREIPRLDELWQTAWGQAEFALLTRFKYHHKRLCDALKKLGELSNWLDLRDSSELDEGMLGKPDSGSFHLSDDSDKEFSILRKEIKNQRKMAEEVEGRLINEISKKHGLSAHAPQWVIDRNESALIENLRIDDRVHLLQENIASLRFAPTPPKELLQLRADLERLYIKEREHELLIYSKMEKKLRPNELMWRSEQEKLGELDLLVAHARLAKAWGGIQPRIVTSNGETADSKISVGTIFELGQGRHPIIEKRISDEGGRYLALDLKLDSARAVLSGTNMGGKTVVLQTIGCLQALTQFGFFVPAVGFRTRLYHRIASLSSYGESLGGLSGFGREIDRLARILPWRERGVLYLIDEPGRSTAVAEGRAIAQAIVEALCQSKACFLLATHLDAVANDGVQKLRMAGLQQETSSVSDSDEVSDTKTAGALQRLMDYRVMTDDGTKKKSDALEVAALLGLEESLISRAKDILEKEENK